MNIAASTHGKHTLIGISKLPVLVQFFIRKYYQIKMFWTNQWDMIAKKMLQNVDEYNFSWNGKQTDVFD